MTDESRRVHVEAEVARGRASLRAAHSLFALGLYNDSVSRAYYAALHFALALLLTEGLEPRTHSGIGSLLGQHFVVTGRIDVALAKSLSRLEQFRGEADYNRFFVFTEATAREELDVADRFCESIATWFARHGW